jgi:SAM-dependent methyltransferase
MHMQIIKGLWKAVEDRYIGGRRYFFLTPSHYSLYFHFIPVLKKYVKGVTLDLGAGRLAWKFLVTKLASKYVTEDLRIENPDLHFVADATSLSVKNSVCDTVICFQVLEHADNPARILQELDRVLKTGGYALVSFPHLSYLHGEPDDYFRFTVHGFKVLCPPEIEIKEVRIAGGLVSFAATPFFIALQALFCKIPVVGQLIFCMLAIASVAVFHIDMLFGIKKLYPLNYICCLKKK